MHLSAIVKLSALYAVKASKALKSLCKSLAFSHQALPWGSIWSIWALGQLRRTIGLKSPIFKIHQIVAYGPCMA